MHLADFCSHMALSPMYDVDTAATKLLMTKRQLLAQVAAGNIRFVNYGLGKHRDLRFTEEMLEELVAKMTFVNTPAPVVVPKPTAPKPANDSHLGYRERLLARKAQKGA